MSANDGVFQRALAKLLTEIFDGPAGNEAYLLNPGDPGLLRQLESIDARAASARPMPGKTTIASHIDHVLYGLTLLNRWAAGEANPWADSDWNASWQRTSVTDEGWRTLRDRLGQAVASWQKVIEARSDWDDITAAGAISSAAHTAYHLVRLDFALGARSRPTSARQPVCLRAGMYRRCPRSRPQERGRTWPSPWHRA